LTRQRSPKFLLLDYVRLTPFKSVYFVSEWSKISNILENEPSNKWFSTSVIKLAVLDLWENWLLPGGHVFGVALYLAKTRQAQLAL
jgi:hypothetical protein